MSKGKEPGVTVEIGTKPSDEAVKMRVNEATITDTQGRVIKLKRPSALATFRLVEALGDSASNAMYRSMVLPLIFVESIDGQPVHTATKQQIELLIQRLEESAINAVHIAVNENFGESSPEKDRDDLKK